MLMLVIVSIATLAGVCWTAYRFGWINSWDDNAGLCKLKIEAAYKEGARDMWLQIIGFKSVGDWNDAPTPSGDRVTMGDLTNYAKGIRRSRLEAEQRQQQRDAMVREEFRVLEEALRHSRESLFPDDTDDSQPDEESDEDEEATDGE